MIIDLIGIFKTHCFKAQRLSHTLNRPSVNSTYISGHSAWRQPHELVINIIEFYAKEYDTEVTASMTYEDEFRNFMGKQYYGSDKCENDGWYAWEGDYNETDGDELMNQFNELYPSIDTESEDFDYHGEYEVEGEKIYPSEVLDELADEFWSRC